ncbi:MAG: hypothetical protein ACD_81C00041G0001 [uncultured bacterium]|uniref:NYN domain-containing protein n=1 Tax=Candidatus Wolfebacteria bacterium GW2011_GWE2_44_13 TaxID=1619017 RepID=A0A0G1JIY7_9BACT|nr:MAG: hypothetical protein ACD_81C00041G0001 [uncultured bacterium]KKT43942.1 MAG: hypothetical protein UW32_C0001G0534 [Candidatus Wolfebacteria bacterium GW2011_GWE2_44_13]
MANNYAFIDSQNLNLGVGNDVYDKQGEKVYEGWKLDFERFRVYLKDKYGVTKAFIFIGYVPTNQRLYTALQKFGYILIFKPTLELPNGKVKGNADAEMVLHAMIEYINYEKALIVSGDGDFYCLVEYLNNNKKLHKLLVPNKEAYSNLLNSVAVDKIDFMNNLRNRLEYKKEGQLHKDQPL